MPYKLAQQYAKLVLLNIILTVSALNLTTTSGKETKKKQQICIVEYLILCLHHNKIL